MAQQSLCGCIEMTVTYNTETSFRIKTILFGEPGFIMHDKRGFSIIPRASFELSPMCPENYKQVIDECIRNGWLKSVAHMKESEWIWEELGD